MIPNPNVVGTIQLKKHDRRKDVPNFLFPAVSPRSNYPWSHTICSMLAVSTQDSSKVGSRASTPIGRSAGRREQLFGLAWMHHGTDHTYITGSRGVQGLLRGDCGTVLV